MDSQVQSSTPLPIQPGVSASRPDVLFPHELPSAQHLLLPRTLPRVESFELAGSCETSQQVGGDFYDVISFSNGKTWLFIADVMGKGVHAALLAATVRGLARMLARVSDAPSALLHQLNEALFDELAPNAAFVTMQVALVDTQNNRLRLANAGHCPALVACTGQHCRSLAPDGIPLGIFPEAFFCEESLELSHIQSLLLHTDGLSDALSPGGERFGFNRLRRWLSGWAVVRGGAEELKRDLASTLAEFQGGNTLSDDQTFLLLTRSNPLSPTESVER